MCIEINYNEMLNSVFLLYIMNEMNLFCFRSWLWDHWWERSGAPLTAFHGSAGKPKKNVWRDTDWSTMGPYCCPLCWVRRWFIYSLKILSFPWIQPLTMCFFSSRIKQVRLGVHSIKKKEKGSTQVIQVESNNRYPHYVAAEKGNDLMLLKVMWK